MSMKEIARAIWVLEGKKQKTSIANVREILSVLSDLMMQPNGADVMAVLIANGKRRLAVKKKK
jgi:hypothetical protein